MAVEYLPLFPEENSGNRNPTDHTFACENLVDGKCNLPTSLCTFGKLAVGKGMGVCNIAETDGGL